MTCRTVRALVALCSLALCFFGAAPACAQGGAPAPPRVSVFGGVSFLPGGDEDFPRLTTSTGFQAGAALQVTHWFAVFADVGGHGVDVDLTRRLAIRGEFDAFWSLADIVEGNSRFAVGLVVRVGG
jgi:hypothetical protein